MNKTTKNDTMKNFTLMLLFFCSITFAQKTAPAAGHAARLVDLLKKDYNTVDVATRAEIINKDIEEVINVLMVYADPDDLDSFTNNAPFTNTVLIGYQNALNKYSNLNKTVSSFSISGTESKSIFDSLEDANNEVIEKKQTYDGEKYEYNITILETIRDNFQKNNNYLSYMATVFLEKYYFVNTLSFDPYAQSNYTSSIQKALPFFGGDLAFSEAIDGLSRFLAKRIKDELTVYAMEKVQNYLNNPKPESYLNELMVLLPTTTSYLKSFDASRTLNFVDDLKQYIENDLNNLIANAANLKSTPRFKKYIEQNPDLNFAFEALELLPQILKIENPIDYFDMLENSRNIQRWSSIMFTAANDTPVNALRYNIANSIKLASMLAHSLMVVEDGKPKFATTTFMAGYSSEVNFYLLYIGFLHQQNKKYYNITYRLANSDKEIDFSYIMDKFSPNNVNQKGTEFKMIAGSLTRIASNAEKLHNSLLNIKKINSSGEKVTAEQVYTLTSDVIDFSEDLLFTVDTLISNPDFKLLGNLDTESIVKKTVPYITTARAVNDIFLDLHTKNYTTAILKAIEIPTAFRKNDKQYALYNSILIGTNNLNALQQLYNLKEFLKYDEVMPQNELENQRNLAVWINSTLKENPNISADITNKFDKLYNAVFYDPQTINYSTFKKDFIMSIKNSLFFNAYSGIDALKLKGEITTILTDKGITDPKIPIMVEIFLNNSVEAYLFEDKNIKEKVKRDKEIILSNLKYFVPEIFPDIFQFRDENTVKLIHFVNDIANSGSAEEVEKALNSFALPPGSSSLKEKVKDYYSINSFPGLFGGFTTTSVDKGDSYSLGFTAPVGIYFQPWKSGNKTTLGIFIPIIDIAAPVRLRLGNNTDELPDLEFKDIFSPGFYLSLGFNKSPFAINVGGQFGPSLNGFENTTDKDLPDVDKDTKTQKTVTKQAFYLSAALTIDIPLFTIHAKSKN